MSSKQKQKDAKYANLDIKTSFEIDLNQGKWTFPCARDRKKYVVRDESRYKEFNNLNVLFDSVDQILSVSIFFFILSLKGNI